MANTWLSSLAHLVRGALIGVAETIPGVSGGTVALVTGIYETLLRSADQLLRVARFTVALAMRRTDLATVRHELGQVEWRVLIPVGFGMVTALIIAARLIEPLLETYPEETRALFAGLVLASIAVPLRMVHRPFRATDAVVFVAAAAIAAFVTGFPPASAADPMLILVGLAAAAAVSALVLPGVSGSFLLLTVGLYNPTISAVNDRDLAYLAVFALGALVGLAVFVKVLRWLLANYRRWTLIIMAGLMLGSLRALWPWQDDDRVVEAPAGDALMVSAWFLLGIAVVFAVILAESRIQARQGTVDDGTLEEATSDR